MGRTRVTYKRWFVGLDGTYMGLGAANDAVDAGVDQVIVEPSVGYKVAPFLEVLGGARYNSLAADLKFRGPLAAQVYEQKTWWDPFFGGRVIVPFGKKYSFTARLDIGGFGAGSKVAVNAEPLFNMKVGKRVTLNAGWKFYYVDYKDDARQLPIRRIGPGPADRGDISLVGDSYGMRFPRAVIRVPLPGPLPAPPGHARSVSFSLLSCLSLYLAAQELQPRAYIPSPVGLNFFSIGYSSNRGGLLLDPSLPVEDAHVQAGIAQLAFGQTLGLLGRTVQLLAVLPYAAANLDGRFAGSETASVPLRSRRCGLPLRHEHLRRARHASQGVFTLPPKDHRRRQHYRLGSDRPVRPESPD